MPIDFSTFRVLPNKEISVETLSTKNTSNLTDDDLKQKIKRVVKEIEDWQNVLYAENKQSLLIIMQGMDAAGKDSAIKEIMTGVNPQGVEIHSFKKPNSTELEHDYLWRHYVKLPERGKITIFNRSQYENVLITKVHPEYLLYEHLPNIEKISDANEDFWNNRYEQINNFEKTLTQNGTKVIKFMLNISKEEQKNRFIKRIENKEKNWKFSSADVKERKYWDEYMDAFNMLLNKTSTNESPWYIIPCDDKKYAQYIMASIINDSLKEMNPKFPEISPEEKEQLEISYQELKGVI